MPRRVIRSGNTWVYIADKSGLCIWSGSFDAGNANIKYCGTRLNPFGLHKVSYAQSRNDDVGTLYRVL